MGAVDIFTVLIALTVVIAMILLSRKGWQVLERFRPKMRAAAGIAVESMVALDGRRRVSVIECRGHRALILTGGPTDLMIALPPDGPIPRAITGAGI